MSDITSAVSKMINKAYDELGEIDVTACVTGSGGFSVGKWLSLPFVQEVIAASSAVKKFIPRITSYNVCYTKLLRVCVT